MGIPAFYFAQVRVVRGQGALALYTDMEDTQWIGTPSLPGTSNRPFDKNKNRKVRKHCEDARPSGAVSRLL